MSSLVRGLGKSITANIASQLITVIIQLVSLPAFLLYWDSSEYGKWLILSAVPIYLTLADIGVLGVAGNEMTMLFASGSKSSCNSIFNSAIVMMMALSICFFSAILAATAFFSIFGHFDSSDAPVIILLCLYSLLSLYSGIPEIVCRAGGIYSFGTVFLSLMRLTDFLGGFIGLAIFHSPMAVAVGMLGFRAVGLLLFCTMARAKVPDIVWNFRLASRSTLTRLFRPSIYFALIPIGNAFSIQGMTILWGTIAGPASLAVFNTFRTISRLLIQIATIISKAYSPVFSAQAGTREIAAMLILAKRAQRYSIICSTAIAAVLLLFGQELIGHWTRGKVPFDPLLFFSFICVALISVVYQIRFALLLATNRHIEVARVFILASVFGLLLTYISFPLLGKFASAMGMALIEIIMLSFVFRFGHKTWG